MWLHPSKSLDVLLSIGQRASQAKSSDQCTGLLALQCPPAKQVTGSAMESAGRAGFSSSLVVAAWHSAGPAPLTSGPLLTKRPARQRLVSNRSVCMSRCTGNACRQKPDTHDKYMATVILIHGIQRLACLCMKLFEFGKP